MYFDWNQMKCWFRHCESQSQLILTLLTTFLNPVQSPNHVLKSHEAWGVRPLCRNKEQIQKTHICHQTCQSSFCSCEGHMASAFNAAVPHYQSDLHSRWVYHCGQKAACSEHTSQEASVCCLLVLHLSDTVRPRWFEQCVAAS